MDRGFGEELSKVEELLKFERMARRSYLDGSIKREVDLLVEMRLLQRASDGRRKKPEDAPPAMASRRQIAAVQATKSPRQLANHEKGVPALIVEFLEKAGENGATSSQILEFARGEGRKPEAVDRAKQRLKKDDVLFHENKIWRLAKYRKHGERAEES